MAFSDDVITATNQLSVTDGAGGPAFAEFLPAAGKAYFVGKLGVGTINPSNALDVEGALAVGAAYAGGVVAPANGLIVEGSVGVGTGTPGAKLDVAGTFKVSENAQFMGNVGIGAATPSNGLHISGSSPALRLADGSQADGRILVCDASGQAAWKDNSRYFAANLPTAELVATTAPQKIVDCLTFSKTSAASAIEVHLNTRVDPGKQVAFVPSGRVTFQLRIDNAVSSFSNVVQVPVTGADEFISIFAVFQSLAAGTHVVSVWAHTNVGLSGSVNLNPDGGGKVIVKETF